jgi:hypothetical protein
MAARASGDWLICGVSEPEWRQASTMLLPLVLAAEIAVHTPAPAPVREIGQGVYLLAGGFEPEPESGPDGNTIIFDAPDGLVVVDTGRHAWCGTPRSASPSLATAIR